MSASSSGRNQCDLLEVTQHGAGAQCSVIHVGTETRKVGRCQTVTNQSQESGERPKCNVMSLEVFIKEMT